MSSLTPMMQQYFEIKNKYQDTILFYRLGDFYEMFFDDALTASRELEITLTGRDCGQEERAPMCGVPFHSADSYIAKLISKGYKVAIAEQVEDPALAKGIVKRDVVKIITPGTVTDLRQIDEKKNNYLMSIVKLGECYGISIIDITTGEFKTTSITFGNTNAKVIDEIAKFAPSEIFCNDIFYNNSEVIDVIKNRFSIYVSCGDSEIFNSSNAYNRVKLYFSNKQIEQNKDMPCITAAGALLAYVENTQKMSINNLSELVIYSIDEYMAIDSSSRRNLELTETMRDKKKRGSLLGVIDKTKTAMGGRKLKNWLEQPLLDVDEINYRLNSVEQLKDKFIVRAELLERLRNVYDLERIASKIAYGSVNCRDLISLKNSIGELPGIKSLLAECDASGLKEYTDALDTLQDVCALIESSIIDDPPITIKEGGIIKHGFDEKIDKLKDAALNGKTWLAELETREREATGITKLKVGFNKVFGYFIEVTKSYLDLVPETYIRKQTLANCERYITQELKDLEESILTASNDLINLEYDMFLKIRDAIAKEIFRIKSSANVIAELDALCSLAEVADRSNYCRPVINNSENIRITNGRHPVVEAIMNDLEFIPNDANLDLNENRLAIITGPNMAGKSTYMRQIALIVIMAQMGGFVPAEYAEIGIVDKIFTRIGASDDLSSGQSTFMVEMTEVANILANATKRSLLILDEIGRGTSTYDGLSIAWAVLEYIVDSNRIGSRTLFATHYHELTELEGSLSGVKNYCISVKKKGKDIIFLRKIVLGGADGSYGVEVARLAGLPEAVINRANDILQSLEVADISKNRNKKNKGNTSLEGQFDLFNLMAAERGHEDLINEISEMDLSLMTPLQAIQKLYDLQQKIKGK